MTKDTLDALRWATDDLYKPRVEKDKKVNGEDLNKPLQLIGKQVKFSMHKVFIGITILLT